MDSFYKKQVSLLLRIIPEINKIDEFALHGGTAINLFYFNMPRLSIDIDLTYIPFENREKDLKSIKLQLDKLSERLQIIIPRINIKKQQNNLQEVKLFCRLDNLEVKIEVNTINRGLVDKTQLLFLCAKAQKEFNMFCEIKTVPLEQLFGGKIIAALDRQHPRDLFDTKHFLDTHELDDFFMKGFLFCLFSSKRPIFEILQPNFIDYSDLIQNQFSGMTSETFTPEMYKNEQIRLSQTILRKLNPKQKSTILSFAKANPTWPYGDWSQFPGIAWKLKNIEILKTNNPRKYEAQHQKLNSILTTTEG